MNDIVLKTLDQLPAEYSGMVQSIIESLPAVARATDNFYKASSQFKSVTLDNTALTPMRSIRQILAEVDRTRQALEEAHIKVLRAEVDLDESRDRIAITEYDVRRRGIDVLEKELTIKNARNYMAGAVRKMAFQIAQYKQVLAEIGKTSITEEDFEKEEALYHVMTAFKQALCAARARGGVIDEGNFIYLFDLGINGHDAQRELTSYLEWERGRDAARETIPHAATVSWLRRVAEKFMQCPVVAASARGLSVIDRGSLLAAP